MSNTQAELFEYLKRNNLNSIFVSIVEAILVEKPENPIGFMTKFLLVNAFKHEVLFLFTVVSLLTFYFLSHILS